jgi:hypothetical protein
MTARTWTLGVGAAALLLAGCGAPHATETASMPGMSMAPGQTMPPSGSATTSASAAEGPSAAAKMVCSDDIKGKVKQVLKLSAEAPTRTSFVDHLYTCTYTLPQGPLVLSVHDSASKAAAGAYYTALRPTLGQTSGLPGLGEHAYGTSRGTVVVLKDSQTLVVDATALPSVFGSDQQKRTDLAYEIASDVVGCWTGDD